MYEPAILIEEIIQRPAHQIAARELPNRQKKRTMREPGEDAA
ncbi:hypothetical protein [Methanoregula sp.]|nr:hypothetical protein [Methanoregula sp.]